MRHQWCKTTSFLRLYHDLALSRLKIPTSAGVIANEVPAVSYTLKNLKLGSHTANNLCASLVGLCDYPAVRPYNLSFPSPKPPTSRPPPSGQDPIKVVHFSDTHVDLSYEPGPNYDCSKPICCRAYTAEDAPGNTSSPCGPWGKLVHYSRILFGRSLRLAFAGSPLVDESLFFWIDSPRNKYVWQASRNSGSVICWV